MNKDLVVLAADKSMQFAVKGLLSRPKALDIRNIESEVLAHPNHDPGCARNGVKLLSTLSDEYSHGLLMFDHEGSGLEQKHLGELQDSLEQEFASSVREDWARVVVLRPELESWIWSVSPHVDEVAGWSGREPTLREWLRKEKWLVKGQIKPEKPKEAFQAALREVRKPRSASLYLQIAKRVSLRQCSDESFLKFRSVLQGWFR